MKFLFVTILIWSSAASASDCNLEQLSQSEKDILESGQIVQRADWSGGIDSYSINSWAVINAASLKDAVAQYYAYETYQEDANLVEVITLSHGERASNNPVRYDVTPKETNPFGALYMPFTFELSIRPEGRAYLVNLKTLTSPNVVRHFNTVSCFVEMQGKVLMHSDTQFIGNPELGFDYPMMSPQARLFIWKQIVMSTVKKSSSPATAEQLSDLETALRAAKN